MLLHCAWPQWRLQLLQTDLDLLYNIIRYVRKLRVLIMPYGMVLERCEGRGPGPGPACSSVVKTPAHPPASCLARMQVPPPWEEPTKRNSLFWWVGGLGMLPAGDTHLHCGPCSCGLAATCVTPLASGCLCRYPLGRGV